MYLFKFWFSLERCLGVGLQDYMVVLFLVFWGTSILFAIVVVPIYIPTNSVGGFPFLHILSNICYLLTLMMATLTGVRWYLIVLLIHNSLIISDAEHFFFMCLLVICMSSSMKCLFRPYAYFSSTLFVLLLLSFMSLYILEINLCWLSHLQNFSPILWVVFSFFSGFLCCAEALEFN